MNLSRFLLQVMLLALLGCTKGTLDYRSIQTPTNFVRLKINAKDGVAFIYTNRVAIGESGFLYVPPRSRVALVQVFKTVHWTCDRLEKIEKRIRTGEPQTVDLTFIAQALRTNDMSLQRAEDAVFEDMVRNGFTARGSGFDPLGVRILVHVFLKEKIEPLVNKWDGESKIIVQISCTSRELGCIIGMKRIIAVNAELDPTRSDDFGEYYDIEGTGEGPGWLKIARAGALVLQQYEGVEGRLSPGAAMTQFCKIGDEFLNESACPIWVRLGINDRLPEDNGLGYTEVAVRIEPIY